MSSAAKSGDRSRKSGVPVKVVTVSIDPVVRVGDHIDAHVPLCRGLTRCNVVSMSRSDTAFLTANSSYLTKKK